MNSHSSNTAGGRFRKRATISAASLWLASPSHRGLAREEVTLRVDGVEHVIEIVRQERIHGQEAYWCCPRCGELRWHLYVHNSEVACRVCLGLSYACRHHNAAAIRARKLRRRLGGLPGLLSPIPPRPRHWRRDYWARAIAELVAVEATLAARLRDMVGRKRKRV